MFGFIFGIACLYGLTKVARGRGCSRRGWRGRGRWRRGGGFRRMFFYKIMDRLDTTPGQEKLIRNEVNKVIEHAHETRRAFRRSGDDIARAVRAESLDEGAMTDAFAAQDAALRELREAATKALARIHDVLDTRQREILADMLETGLHRGGPYREWV